MYISKTNSYLNNFILKIVTLFKYQKDLITTYL